MSVTAVVGARLLSASSVLADPTDVGDETHKAGPLAIVVVAVLCVVCFFLFRSMSKHLRRVRDDFPDDGTDPAAPVDAPAVEPVDGETSGVDAASGPSAAGTRPAATASSGTAHTRPAPKSRSHASDT